MRSTVFAVAVALLASAPVLAPAPAHAAPGEQRVRAPAKGAAPMLSRRNTIPVSEIKPGMEGYGLTVFEGMKVERFHIKVIGILRKPMPNQDMVMFSSNDPRLKHTGIVLRRDSMGSAALPGGRTRCSPGAARAGAGASTGAVARSATAAARTVERMVSPGGV